MSLSRTWPFRNRLLQKVYFVGLKRAEAKYARRYAMLLRHLERLSADLATVRDSRQREMLEKAKLERQLGFAMKLLNDYGGSIAMH